MTPSAEFQNLPLAKLRESKDNPRQHFEAKALAELAASIKTHGVLTPILVRPSNGHFEIAAGHRRFRAAKLAGVEKVPGVVREMSDSEFLEVLTIENLQREDVHPLEEAAGYRSLLKAGYDVDKIAERVNRSAKYVYDRIKLTALTPAAQKDFFDGRMQAGHAILLARLAPKEQEKVLSHGLYTHDADRPEDRDHKALELEGDDSFDEHEKTHRRHGVYRHTGGAQKAVSVRQLDDYIAHHVRFRPERDADPRLFPATADAVEAANSGDKRDRLVPITEEYILNDDTRDPKERVLTERSWKRADGSKGGPKCESVRRGVFVTGSGRGEILDVCIDKEKCRIHWGAEISARARRQKQKLNPKESKAEANYKAQVARDNAKRAKEEQDRKAFEKATPRILEAIAERVAKMPTKASGLLADIVLGAIRQPYGMRAGADLVKRGTTAEDLIRFLAYQVLRAEVGHSWGAMREFPKRAKALGINLAELLQPQTSAKAAKS